MGFSIHQLICTAKLHGFFQYAKQVACSTGWVLTSVTTHSSSSHKGRVCRRAKKDVLTQQKGTGTSNIRPKPASPPPQEKTTTVDMVSFTTNSWLFQKTGQLFPTTKISRFSHDPFADVNTSVVRFWNRPTVGEIQKFQWKSPTFVISMKCVPCWL